MTATTPARRNKTARELAEQFGVSTRTIQRAIAEPRDQYEARTAIRHERIRELRKQGLSMRAIAAEVGVSVGTVHYALNKNAQKSHTNTAKKQPKTSPPPEPCSGLVVLESLSA